MGVVYAAYDPELDRRIAVKLLRARQGSNAARAQARLLREAQAMARLAHPNVAVVHDVGTHGAMSSSPWNSSAATPLQSWLRQRPRTWQEVLEVFVQAGRGLAAAHRRGPGPPRLQARQRDDRRRRPVRVLDFGLARAELGHHDDANDSALMRVGAVQANVLSTDLTVAGAVLGTPAFMSPEQHLGRPTDPRSDQFSFS
jgi:serine/threonine protein kinase